MGNKKKSQTVYRSLCSIVLMLTMFSVAVANDNNLEQTPAKWSLQFGIERDFQLGDFDGMQVSIRKHSSAQKAWRLGASLQWLIRDSDRVNSQSNQSSQSFRNTDSYQFRTNIIMLREWHPVRSKSINMILGLGPELGLEISNRKITQLSGSPASEKTSEYNSDSYNAGLRGILGVEWFVAGQISLIGEYALSMAYSYHSTEISNKYVHDTNKSTTNSKLIKIATNSVNFGVSVYF